MAMLKYGPKKIFLISKLITLQKINISIKSPLFNNP
jgi:hypothetical protein